MNRHYLLLARHEASETGGWVKIVIWFKLSHVPWGGVGGNLWPQLGEHIIINFTLLI